MHSQCECTLARLLSVLDKTMGELKKYYDSMGATNTDSRGPYWTDDGRLEYKGKLLTSNKWLFEATFDGEKRLLSNLFVVTMAKMSTSFLLLIVLHPNSSSVTHYLVGGMLW